MLKLSLLLSLFVLLNSFDCGSQKQDERIQSLEAEVKQLKAEVASLKQKPVREPEHHYELRNVGFRTFRFDPATGDMCIQLTSAADWKRKDTQSHSCECKDMMQEYLAMPRNTEQEVKDAQNFYEFVKGPCGN